MTAPGPIDPDAFCREVEAYLCRRNEGHLVRVVGPAFVMVADWAARGVPLKIAFRGIDRTVERRAAKGPARRPLRIEFCEADVMDAFDEWRRAVGIGTAGDAGLAAVPGEEAAASERPSKHAQSLRAHLDRVVTRLTDRLALETQAGPLTPVIERLIVELGDAREKSRTIRGDARVAFVARLARLDDEMIDAAEAGTPRDVLDAIEAEAEAELAAFRGRMPDDAYVAATRAAARKLLRERLELPEVAYPC